MKFSFKSLQKLASSLDYTVEKIGRSYQWWYNGDHSIVGECRTIVECASEITQDYHNKTISALAALP